MLRVEVLRSLRDTGVMMEQLRHYADLGEQRTHTEPERLSGGIRHDAFRLVGRRGGCLRRLDESAAHGGNFLDTADCCTAWSSWAGGPPSPDGVSENIVGRCLAARGNRDDVVLATKVRAALSPESLAKLDEVSAYYRKRPSLEV